MQILKNLKQFIKNKFCLYPYTKIGQSVKIQKSNIYVEKGSKLVIGKFVNINKTTIQLKGNSELIIDDDSIIIESVITLVGSKCNLKKGVILQPHENRKTKLFSDQSIINIDANVRLIGTSIYSRFESLLEIGEHSGFSGGTEIFCHEHIKIGKFALVAEDVCIYDTNTHSTEAVKRIAEIKTSYPSGLWDKVKPASAPVLIGENVWIGKGATILKGSVLKNNCIVGMRAIVVRGNFEENSIIVSSQPRVLKIK